MGQLRESCTTVPVTLKEISFSLHLIQPADITIIKSMKNPPAGVKLVLAAVCVMKEIKPERIPDPNSTGRVSYLFLILVLKIKGKSDKTNNQQGGIQR